MILKKLLSVVLMSGLLGGLALRPVHADYGFDCDPETNAMCLMMLSSVGYFDLAFNTGGGAASTAQWIGDLSNSDLSQYPAANNYPMYVAPAPPSTGPVTTCNNDDSTGTQVCTTVTGNVAVVTTCYISGYCETEGW